MMRHAILTYRCRYLDSNKGLLWRGCAHQRINGELPTSGESKKRTLTNDGQLSSVEIAVHLPLLSKALRVCRLC